MRGLDGKLAPVFNLGTLYFVLMTLYRTLTVLQLTIQWI